MEIVKGVLQVLQIIAGILLIALVLLHSPKGDGIGGIGSASQIFSSQRGAEATLDKMTAWTAGILYAASFILGYYLF